MFNSLVKLPILGLSRFVLLMLLILGLCLAAFAQAPAQNAPDAKGTLPRDTGASTAMASSDLASKKILILHSFAYAQPAYKIIDKSLTESFVASGVNFNNLYFEFLDLARNPGQEYRTGLVKFLRNKYKGRKIDLVITLHPDARAFLLKEGRDVYPQGPIISIMDEQDVEHADLKRPLIALRVWTDATLTAKNILSLKPDTRKILIVAGSSAVDRRLANWTLAQLKKWNDAVEVEETPPLPLADILKKVSQLPSKTAILYTTVYSDSTGKTYVPVDVGRMISRSANAPIFGFYETLLGDNGVVGGTMMNHRFEGERAVRSAMEVLQGNVPQKPLTVLPGTLFPMFDWQQMKRWGFSEAALPANAIILNKPVSPWKRYKFYFITALTFFLLETALIIFLIVQRRRKIVAEQELESSEERFRQFFKKIPDYCYIISAEGNILHINEAALKTLGYKREELIGKPLTMIYAPESLPKMKALFDQWKYKGEIKNEEMVIHTRNGEKRTVLLNVGTVRDADGKIIHSASIQTDITAWKQAEMEIERQRQELIRVTRLGALGQLASSLAHEINQPLTAIRANAQAAQQFLGQKKLNLDELREILKDIIEDNERAGEVIRKMRSLIKKKEFAFEKLDINNLIKETIPLLNVYAIRKNKKITMQTDPELPLIDGDRIQLQQVLLNLITNGIDAMAERGPDAGELVISTSKNDSSAVVIAVKDSGGGLPKKEPNRVFEPFYTTKPEGLGMGLVISRSIVEGHGGTLHAENNPDIGATFYVTLPVKTT